MMNHDTHRKVKKILRNPVDTIWRSRVFGAGLSPAAKLFEAVVRIRRGLYKNNIMRVRSLPVPVISVGNITVGGTGKTPLIHFLARTLMEEGYSVGVISRGYGRRSRGVMVVSDGQAPRVPVQLAGDEPYWLARTIPGLIVVVGENRWKAGCEAVNLGCEVILLDDGFQHVRLGRDRDIVVLDGVRLWGNGHLLPAGPLRDPLTMLRVADDLVVSHAESVDETGALESALRPYLSGRPFFSSHEPMSWMDVRGKGHALDHLKNRRILAFAGIGNPASFEATLRRCSVSVEGFYPFPDHHWYSREDTRRLIRTAGEKSCSVLVTTEKDWARLDLAEWNDIPVYCLQIRMVMKNMDRFLEGIRKTAGGYDYE